MAKKAPNAIPYVAKCRDPMADTDSPPTEYKVTAQLARIDTATGAAIFEDYTGDTVDSLTRVVATYPHAIAIEQA